MLLLIKNDSHLPLARDEANAVLLVNQLAAFDTIDHGTLLDLDCLSSCFGIGGVVLDWFKSYIFDRSQCVKIGSILSDTKKLFLACLWALFLVQYSFPYILLLLAESFKTILA